MPIGNFPESLSQAMLVGTIVVGRLGVRVSESPDFQGAPCGPRDSTPQQLEYDSRVLVHVSTY